MEKYSVRVAVKTVDRKKCLQHGDIFVLPDSPNQDLFQWFKQNKKRRILLQVCNKCEQIKCICNQKKAKPKTKKTKK